MNTIGDACDDPKDEQCIKIKAWIDKNFEWMYSQINENQVDPYWHHVIISIFYSLYKNARMYLIHILIGFTCFGTIRRFGTWILRKRHSNIKFKRLSKTSHQRSEIFKTSVNKS